MTISNNVSELVTLEETNSVDVINNRTSPYDESFEAIYKKAQSEKVTPDSSKDFLKTLSDEELLTLKNYSMVGKDINVESLNKEAAYNLLMHFSEKRDINDNGLVENSPNTVTSSPSILGEDEQQALLDALTQSDNKNNFNIMSMIFKGVDEKGNAILNNTSDLSSYEDIMNRMDALLERSASSNDKNVTMLSKFKELFESSYNTVLKEKQSQKEASYNPLLTQPIHNYPTEDFINQLQS
ncbi:hypothetical protein [Candidatus Marinarcus aquaticus]|uniref:Uncharacterized protein n=1 Tax=Candidatus Marinarcus aquaticus TaxID=2044504 RepID=A0A4Q0XTL0_9BACT|nr:hypothetical protein [Candidatus Marinarcus aquaticus]RXJ60756.1 hypothetical protein CRV04_01715 [Candidatus Marinarcus aquaticus]